MLEMGYPFDTVQMPLNPFDASFHRFEFADLACGEPVVPDTASHEQARANLVRIYGDHTRVARELEDRLQVNQ